MSYQLDRIKSLINKHDGFQMQNRYKVILPNIHLGNDTIAMDVFCRSVTIPGKALTTVNRRTNMKDIAVPVAYTTEETIQMQFLETNDNLISRYFDFWLDTIVSPFDYKVQYRDNYARNVFILKLDKQNDFTYGILLRNAYPKSKALVTHSNDGNQVLEQIIIMAYEDYEIVDASLTGIVNKVISTTRANILGVPLSNLISIGRVVNNVIT